MDSSSYERKWVRLREYLPFLRKMIDKLEGRKGSSAELAKVKSLHRVLSSRPSGGNEGPFLRMETLLKCEEILKVLYEQVEGPVLESPKSPPRHHSSYHFQGNPRVIPLERRSGGLEFTHQKQQQPLTYGEYRRLRQQHQTTDYTYNSPPPPRPRHRPPPPTLESQSDALSSKDPETDEDLTDSESESLQIDEQLPLVKKEEKSPIKEPEVEEVYSIASPDPEELSGSEVKVEPGGEKEDEEMEVETESKVKEQRELKPENKPIFFASEDTPPFQPEFTYKDVKFSPTRVNEMKYQSDSIKQVHDKISNFATMKNKRSAKVRLKVTEVKERSSSLIHPENDNVVLTERPQCYSNKISDIINRLKINVTEVAEEEHDLQLTDNSSEESLLDLLPLIKDLKKDTKDTKVSPLVTDKCLKKVKTKDNIDFILPLFKCWISSCNFATDALDDYRSHLQVEKVTTYHCVYCQKEFDVVDEFLDHVIYTHGRCPYQCPYCDFRSTSTLSILIHEQHLHPDQKRCYLLCKHLSGSEESDTSRKSDVVKCSVCHSFSSVDVSSLMLHMNEKHSDRVDSIQFHCLICSASFIKIIELLLHHTFKHGHSPLRVGLLEIEKVSKIETTSSTVVKLTCGYSPCKATFESLDDFKKHMKECTEVSGKSGVECCYCKSNFESRDALLNHIIHHEQFRYSCGLCSTKDIASAHIVRHMKRVHGVDKSICTPCIPSMKDKNKDPFVYIPEKAFKRSEMFNMKKDVYSPDQICEIPRISMFKSPIHCSECDFVSKVRMNFIKHMKLHKKSSHTGVITPINPPPCIDGRHFKNMGAMNEEEDKVLTEVEIAAMPVFIPENQRFKCCSSQCNYITIDEVMLIYHINTLHPKFKKSYACPHCSDVQVDYEELGFHLKCHGDLLFKCPYCTYYHWQKRTAQQHVVDMHKDIRAHIRDVRKDAETRKKTIQKVEPLEIKEKENPPELNFFPYYCGLCDKSFESLSEVEYHIMYIHGVEKQFHCCVCTFSADDRTLFKEHLISKHGDNQMIGIQTFYVKQSTTDANKISHSPLWSRKMTRVRHIRGILFDDGKIKKVSSTLEPPPPPTEEDAAPLSPIEDDSPYPYKAKCVKCGVIKKSIKNLKTHIQTVHLKSTKFSCTHCSYTAGTLKSVKIHHKKCHPNLTFVMTMDDKDVAKFDHNYWRSTWKIPKPNERKRLGCEAQSQYVEPKKGLDVLKCKHCTYSSNTQKSLKIHSTKCHPNVKLELSLEVNQVVDLTGDVEMKEPTVSFPSVKNNLVSEKEKSHLLDALMASKEITPKLSISNENSILSESGVDKQKILKKSKDILSAAQEISPFEHVPTFKCLYCPKRTQSLIRIERHLSTDHPNHTSGHRMLTRDQIVEMITDGPNTQDYSCYFCDKGGNIHEMQEHFSKSHSDQTMKVKKRLRNSGYLECQICGYLTPGFDRSQQKVHYHDEHPLEENIVAHKYVQKRKNGPQGGGGGGNSPGEGNDKKFDFNKFAGETIKCPKTNCDFDSKSASAIMAHLKKHTQTYKCGHCGNIFTQSSAFNNHSAMMHGDKIPDLVKDMEAEAEFEALKGLLEASLCKSSKN